MIAPIAPPTRLTRTSVLIVRPGGVSASARPVKPVTSWAGNSATVEVMLAARASMPVSISDGRVMNEPPPASAFCVPAHIAAMKRTTRAVICNAPLPLLGWGRWRHRASGRTPVLPDGLLAPDGVWAAALTAARLHDRHREPASSRPCFPNHPAHSPSGDGRLSTPYAATFPAARRKGASIRRNPAPPPGAGRSAHQGRPRPARRRRPAIRPRPSPDRRGARRREPARRADRARPRSAARRA